MVMLYAGCRAVLAPRRTGYRAALGYLALGAAAAGSVICTPYGTGVIHYYKAVNSVTPALSRYVTEWERPDPLYLVSIGFFALLVAVRDRAGDRLAPGHQARPACWPRSPWARWSWR